jgi:hypothetical protein
MLGHSVKTLLDVDHSKRVLSTVQQVAHGVIWVPIRKNQASLSLQCRNECFDCGSCAQHWKSAFLKALS